MGDTVVAARLAASLLPIRDGREGDGLEVLMLRRQSDSRFAPNRWVFPGGAVDEADRCPPPGVCVVPDAARLRQRLRVEGDLVVGWLLAAVRETFEEAGILVVSAQPGASVPDDAERRKMRMDLLSGRVGALAFGRWLAAHGLTVDPAGLAPVGRWVTPRPAPKRFDVLFLLGVAPEGQRASADGGETVEERWVRPAGALAAWEAGTMELMRPTRRMLAFLADSTDVADARARAQGDGPIRPVLPHRIAGADGRREHLDPGASGYPMAPFAEEFPEWA